MSRRRYERYWWAALAIIVVVGGVARLWNLDWDRGQHLHPDERHWSFVLDGISAPDGIREYFDTDASPLNPYAAQPTFVYGTLPLFATKATAAVLEQDALRPLVRGLDTVGIDLLDEAGEPRFDSGYRANLIGRLLSALADTATIGLVGALGRLLGGRRAGLPAAGVYALTVLPIQLSHFLGPDTFATFFTTATLVTAVLHLRCGGAHWVVFGGALAAAATACRVQAVLVMVALVVAVVLRVRAAPDSPARWRQLAVPLVGAAVSAALVFRIAQPYAFDGWWLNRTWVEDLLELRRLQSGVDMPPNLQWVGRTPLVYPLHQLAAWAVGPGIVMAAGLGAWHWWRVRQRVALPLLAVVTTWLVLISTSWTPTMRYLMPILPIVATAAGAGLAALARATVTGSSSSRRWVGVATGALIASIVIWASAFVHGVYGHPHSRVAATEWIASNVPAGSILSVDAWDDALPLGLPGVPAYEFEPLDPFAPDSTDKIETLIEQLERVDLVVVSSQRARDSVARLPARFPSTLRYYEALADGSLGFDLVARFHNVPRLGPLRIDTSSAEEAFSVYDHPPVELYRRSERFSTTTARRALDPALASTALAPPLLDGGANALLLTPAERDRLTSGDTFDQMFPRRGPFAVVLWVAGWLALATAGVAWSTRLLPRSPAGSAALSLVLGPLVVTVGAWSLVAWDVVQLSTWVVRAVAVAFISAGWVTLWFQRSRVLSRIRHDRAAWATVGVAAGLVFIGMLALRLGNPDLWHSARGGEKPMEVAQLTAIARSLQVPPPDPWFAGGTLNYYYLGFFHLAMPIRALGITPDMAFSLGLATVASSTAALAAAVGHDIARLARGRWRVSRRSAIAAALSVAGVVVLGNLDAVRQVIGQPSVPFDWWRPSRVHTGTFDITEFPAWSYLFGDLHPHLMATWLTVLVVMLAVALIAHAVCVPPSRVLHAAQLVALGVVVGVVHMTHTWDLPATVVLVAAALLFARVRRTVDPTMQRVLASTMLDGATVVAVAALITAPYRRRSMVFNDSIEGSPVTTRFVDQLVHLGPWWLLAIAFVWCVLIAQWTLRRQGDAQRWRSAQPGAGISVAAVAGAAFPVAVGVIVSWTAAVSLVIVGGAAITIVVAMRGREREPAIVIVAGLFAAGVGLAAVPEFVVVAPDIERLNTVFKLTFQAWHLLALAAGPAVVFIARGLHDRPPPLRAAAGVTASAALVAMLAFSMFAIRPRLADRMDTTIGPTLDGLAYLDSGWSIAAPNGTAIRPGEDLALVEWLRAEVVGQPTIVEMVGQAYGWNARISVLTGLPTVMGWPWHQTQQRLGFAGAVADRYSEVERLYTSADVGFAEVFLRAHRVEFIVIGTLELASATPEALAALESVAGAEVVVSDGGRRVIAIDQDVLADALAARSPAGR